MPIATSALIRRFLLLGVASVGGPAAHVALMEREFVTREPWLTRERFLRLLGLTQIIPGPNSTELAILIGHDVGGWQGGVIAGACFILPAALLTAALGWLYVHAGGVGHLDAIGTAFVPIVAALVLDAFIRLGRTAVRGVAQAVVLLIALVAAAAGVNELLVLLAGAIAMLAAVRVARDRVRTTPDLLSIFLVFTKIGATLFGSGYVLVALLRADLVERLRWITDAVLVDGVVVGQVTPGPLFTTATFLGWVLRGPEGAAAATIGIFLPAFLLAGVSASLLRVIERRPLLSTALEGVTLASLALMLPVVVRLGIPVASDPWAWLIFAGAFVGLRLGWPSIAVIAGSGAVALLHALA